MPIKSAKLRTVCRALVIAKSRFGGHSKQCTYDRFGNAGTMLDGKVQSMRPAKTSEFGGLTNNPHK